MKHFFTACPMGTSVEQIICHGTFSVCRIFFKWQQWEIKQECGVNRSYIESRVHHSKFCFWDRNIDAFIHI